jgi:hypothetical protein
MQCEPWDVKNRTILDMIIGETRTGRRTDWTVVKRC